MRGTLLCCVALILALTKADASPSANQLLVQSIYDQVQPCWDGISDLEDQSRLLVSIRFTVLADGNFSGEPMLAYPDRIDPDDVHMNKAVSRALAAVTHCAPYVIPEERAPLPITINFGPLPPGPSLG